MRRFRSAGLFFVVAFLLGGAAQAAQGDWLARARVININPDASSSALNLDVNSRTTLEADFSYFIHNNVALELILATKKHQVTAGGTAVGSVKHLPPTITLQYHFMPQATFRPYVRVGLNYTRFYDINLGGGTLTVDKNSWGGAVQAGADIGLTKTLFLNLDIKRIWIDTDVKSKATGATLANLKINPWIFGIGVGIKF
ncbi:MAG: OmpW family protein [Betaproteobacteria bacterium]|nr:OmpW family protein [Betaproteobacteria bacterium]